MSTMVLLMQKTHLSLYILKSEQSEIFNGLFLFWVLFQGRDRLSSALVDSGISDTQLPNENSVALEPFWLQSTVMFSIIRRGEPKR